MKRKQALITGASRGIGKAIALKFAKEGFVTHLVARNGSRLEETRTEIEQISPAECHIYPVDLADKQETIDFGAHIPKRFGKMDLLVNNAGTFIPGSVYNEEDGSIENMMNTNFYSAYHLSRQLIPGMIEQKSGHIFNVSSVAGIQAYPNGGSYSISKFALMGLTKALREELKKFGIRVTALIPGATYTDSWKESGIEEDRLMPAEDLAELVWTTYNMSARTVVEDIIVRPQLGDL